MFKSICILGRQPSLGIAELESLYGADSLKIVSSNVIAVDIDSSQVNFNRLGGSLKLCSVIDEFNHTNWHDVESYLINNVDKLLPGLDSGKLMFGLSVYGLSVSPQQIQGTGLKLKQAMKAKGQSARVVPNQTLELNSAQVLHNRLVSDKGVELVLAANNRQTIVAQTVAVQNITSYTYRDRGRPKRDTKVGMLPPKLAQIMINLSAPKTNSIVLDPFCGTGVILQEAALSGLSVYGTDVEPRMIEYSEANLEWLGHSFSHLGTWKLEVGDSTKFHWQPFDVVASETYLGHAFFSYPGRTVIDRETDITNKIIETFLSNIKTQLRPGSRLCLAVPAWHDPKSGKLSHLPLLDHLSSLGYNRVSFSHAQNQDLVYFRPDQIVARELMVITRN